MTELPFGRLDFLYTPSDDVARDLKYYEEVLGGRVVFAVEGMGARVAAVELAPDSPLVLLTDHLDNDRTIDVYRVDDLKEALTQLDARGFQQESTFEIPHGPICSFRTPGGQRIAIYELTRPGAAHHFDGRRDF